MLIRPETPEDLDAIRAVHEACFPTSAEADLVDRLRLMGDLQVSLVCEVDGAVVGHIGFSPVRVQGSTRGMGLAPIGVLPGHRRRGIGAALVHEGLDAMDADWCVVLGDPAWYGPLGFQPAITAGLWDAYGGEEAFQVFERTPGTLPQGAGLVRYSRAFGGLH